ncbi:MAG: hypothetical protein K0R17_178 [Rariglobus sp.]|jgi:hypothetical protein|nr:hypothetical protein [Rariglobus sp.]
MITLRPFLAATLLAATPGALVPLRAVAPATSAHSPVFAHVPAQAPRTLVLAGRADAFRAYVTTGGGATAFARLKEDFDREWIQFPFPPEPQTYGDPEPKARDTAKADKWRAAQDACGRVSGVAEAGALLWLGTGDARYLAKAKDFLLRSTTWSLDGNAWEKGPGPGGTDIYYNDEAHFRLWRKLPQVYDLIRNELTDAERAQVLAHLRERGERSAAWIRQGRVEQAVKNSLEGKPSSHPIRFVAMTGLAGLALWDDLPEQSRDWWTLAYTFYRDRFPSWGGDDGGWGEGIAYWRGVIEHASFQDGLLAIGDPLAYNTPFWRNTPYFQIYNVQPYRHSGFGDLSNAGKFDIEPRTAEFLLHLSRVTGDGHLVSYVGLMRNDNEKPAEAGLKDLNRNYPTSAEFLLRNFTAARLPLPAPRPLADLPSSRWFKDVGWVSMHSALGRPDDDIQVTFKSSPYGSFSHSHADQNAFILNAYGENLAINSGYREFHRSPHHKGWTWQTKSKNALLIDGKGQATQDLNATGRIVVYDTGPRHTRATGDATAAYQTEQSDGRVKSVLRDLVFVDRRYVVIRDRVTLSTPSKLTWLLHAESPIEWNVDGATALIRGEKATLTTRLLTPENSSWKATIKAKFDVPVDPKYAKGGVAGFGKTGEWGEQSHLLAETIEARADHVIYAVLWPERDGLPAKPLAARLTAGRLEITRPDGKSDTLTLGDSTLTIE